MNEFTIEHLQIGVGDVRNGRAMLVSCYVRIGPIQLSVNLDQKGEAYIPECLTDNELRHRIAVSIRKEALEKITENWQKLDDRGPEKSRSFRS